MSTQLTRSDPNANPLVVLNRDLETRAAEFRKVLPRHIAPDKFQRTIMTAVQQNPDLFRCDRRSLITAALKAALDGLLPDGREAALVKFTTRVKQDGQWVSVDTVAYLPMVYGLRKKILQTGEVADISANVVYRAEADAGLFVYEEGSARALRHRPKLDLTAEEAADSEIVAAYSMASMKDGTVSYEVVRRFEIDKIRETSQTGATSDRSGQPRQSKGPWADWFGEMAKKTAMRRHSKTLPMSGDILIDVEAGEQDAAAQSTVKMLDHHAGSEPQAIAPPEEVAHDAETGEIVDDDLTESELEAQRDPQTGVTKHPAEDHADALIGAFKLAETGIEIRSIYTKSELDRAAMPQEILDCVETSYQTETKRVDAKDAAANAARKELAK